jgi:hypothetical protein
LISATGGTSVPAFLVDVLLFAGFAADPGATPVAEQEARLCRGPRSVVEQETLAVMRVGDRRENFARPIDKLPDRVRGPSR